METKGKTFDAVKMSLSLHGAVSRKLETMTREEHLGRRRAGAGGRVYTETEAGALGKARLEVTGQKSEGRREEEVDRQKHPV